MKGESIWYLLGVLAGMAASIVVVAILAFVAKKMGGKFNIFSCKKDNAYDERQLLVRGQAYKAAFFILLFYVMVAAGMQEIFDNDILMSLGGLWMGVCLSIAVFAVVCIQKDAYISLQENAKGIIIVFSVLSVMNLISALPSLLKNGFFEAVQTVRDGRIVEDVRFSLVVMNMSTGLLFLVILIVFVTRLVYDAKREQLEDGED